MEYINSPDVYSQECQTSLWFKFYNWYYRDTNETNNRIEQIVKFYFVFLHYFKNNPNYCRKAFRKLFSVKTHTGFLAQRLQNIESLQVLFISSFHQTVWKNIFVIKHSWWVVLQFWIILARISWTGCPRMLQMRGNKK